MVKVDQIVARMRRNPGTMRFGDVVKVCRHYFGEPRQEGTSHMVFRTPWVGDPRVNLQNNQGMAKDYQVRQVIKAIARIEEDRHE